MLHLLKISLPVLVKDQPPPPPPPPPPPTLTPMLMPQLAPIPPMEQHQLQLDHQQAVAAAARLAQQQRSSLQAAVNALCAVLGWTEAAWQADNSTAPPAALAQQLAAGAVGIVATAQQLEEQQRQRDDKTKPGSAAHAASGRRGRQQGKVSKTPGGRGGSQQPAPLAWHLRAAATAVDSVCCLAQAVQGATPGADAQLQLAPAAPCIVYVLVLLTGSPDAAAVPAAAQLVDGACSALAAFAAADEAFCKSLAAADGATSWPQVLLPCSTQCRLHIMLARHMPLCSGVQSFAETVAACDPSETRHPLPASRRSFCATCQVLKALQMRLGDAEMAKHSEALHLLETQLAASTGDKVVDGDGQVTHPGAAPCHISNTMSCTLCHGLSGMHEPAILHAPRPVCGTVHTVTSTCRWHETGSPLTSGCATIVCRP